MKFIDNTTVYLKDVLIDCLKWAKDVDVAVAFIRNSGVLLIAPHFESIVQNGGRIRVIGGQDFGYTEPEALINLDRTGAEIRIFTGEEIFHPKCFIFRRQNDLLVIIGSSNLTSSGLENGVEWNLLIDENSITKSIASRFKWFWSSSQTERISDDLFEQLRKAHQKIISDAKQNKIVRRMDFAKESFQFPFTVNKSFLSDSTHRLTIRKRYNTVLKEHIASDHTDTRVHINDRQIRGYLYRAIAGFGLYHQLRIPNSEFSNVASNFYLGQSIDVTVEVYKGDVDVYIECQSARGNEAA